MDARVPGVNKKIGLSLLDCGLASGGLIRGLDGDVEKNATGAVQAFGTCAGDSLDKWDAEIFRLAPDDAEGQLKQLAKIRKLVGEKEIKTAADGRFRLLNLRPDIQPVTATADGYAPASKVVTPGTNVVEITLQLKQGASLKGIVLDPEGQPVEGANLVYEVSDYDSRLILFRFQDEPNKTTVGRRKSNECTVLVSS